ncbi:putative serine/threonine protein kinase [Blattamonas nauphoetae]|uniref:Serine/threonine protein kinase n=1 Tax=Blattamonas nauphoetae TaxID=2049346 RepID=A0ABQ9Y4S0_9EUKA|nr:putative serine/threonine protein kinase [Blattamonas nauphoetae]
MKVLPFTSEVDFNKNEHEIAKLQNNQHRNVVGFVEVIVEGNAHSVVLELCSCSLADRISESRKLGTTMDRVTVFRIVSDVLAGLGFLHSRNEVYGDLKPSNILIGGDGRAKLGDFGGVVGVGTVKTSNSAECGTMQFWAPEMFAVGGNGGSVSQAGDMWAFGLIVLELLTGQEWISGLNSVEIAESVKAFDVQAVCQKAKIPKSLEPVLCLLLSKNPQERLPSAELIRSGRLMKILGEETPLSQFIREELDTTKKTVDQLLEQLSESERKNEQLEKEKAEWMEEKKQIQQENEQLRSELASKTQKLEHVRRAEGLKQTIQQMKTEVARKKPILASDVIVAFSPKHFRVFGSTVAQINSDQSWAGCFTKPVSKGIHRLSIRNAGSDGLMIGVLDAAEYPKHLTSAVFHSPKAAMMNNWNGSLFSVGDGFAQNTPPPIGQEWSAEADLEKRTLHFFIDGVQQPHHFINISVPLVFAIDAYSKDVPIEITFWGELKNSSVTFEGTGHNLKR